jgi:PAS domain S-box-containing protein
MADVPVDRFRLVVESAPNGIVVIDRLGRVTLVNAQIEKLFGYERGELLGHSVEILIPDRFRGHHSMLRTAFSKQPETRPMGAGRDLYGRRKNGTEFPVEIGLNAISNTGGQDDDQILATVVDITARKKAEEHLRFIMRELSHRTKNVLAVVQVMAWQTARTSTDLEDFEERFTNRVDALACSHNLLIKREWEGVAIEELVHAQLAPFLDTEHKQLIAHGPALLLKPEAAQNLGLALHELATNASKYGALSHPAGRIKVGWDVTPNPAARRRFHMHWREIGGPEVKPPKHTGFGHAILNNTVAKAMAGEVALKFAPEGFVWQLTAPAERMFGDVRAVATDNDARENTCMDHDLLRGQRILIVEDDALLAMSVDDMLREAGADIVGPAATLDSAGQLVAEDHLSAAILDIRLNGDEVWPVARLLTQRRVPFVFYTGHFDSTSLPAEWAARPILTKPARPTQIVGALADLATDH